MRKMLWVLILLATALPASAADSSPASNPGSVKGLWLIADYPAITTRGGQTETVKLKLQNYALPPERVALSVDGAPQGWKVSFLGDGQPVGAAMAATNEGVALQLRLEIPAAVKPGTETLMLHAKGTSASADLPLQVTIADQLPAKLDLTSKLPSLVGTPKSSFDFDLTVKNDSGKDLVAKLGAETPDGFQTTFTEGYGTQEVTSVPVEAGKTKDIKAKIQPPASVSQGDYPATIHVSAENAEAQAKVTMQVQGAAKISLTGTDGRLSGDAEAGKATPISLVVSNDGTAPAKDIELSGSPPTDWKTEFDPKKIDELGPGEKKTVQALLTPSAKALAGDYMTTFRANAKSDSSSADYRVTVTTSTMWGMVGIGLIAIALLVLVGAVARFGRR